MYMPDYITYLAQEVVEYFPAVKSYSLRRLMDAFYDARQEL